MSMSRAVRASEGSGSSLSQTWSFDFHRSWPNAHRISVNTLERELHGLPRCFSALSAEGLGRRTPLLEPLDPGLSHWTLFEG